MKIRVKNILRKQGKEKIESKIRHKAIQRYKQIDTIRD